MTDINKPGIYTIENNINNKIYIGSTYRPIEKRLSEHKTDLKKNKHCSKLLQQDYNTYGIENFTFKVLENIEDSSQIRKIETQWLKTIRPDYNKKSVANDIVDYTPELRKKMSIAHGGRPFEAYDLQGNYVKTFDTQRQCCRELGIKQSNLFHCLKGNTNTIKGYRFKYVGEDFKFVKSTYVKQFPKDVNVGRVPTQQQIEKHKKSMAKFHKENPGAWKLNEQECIELARHRFNAILEVYEDGKLINTFLSVKEASITLNIKQPCISSRMNKPRIRNTKYRYVFIKKELK